MSHTESFVGFEGSYIHAEEPDGAMGSMDAGSLKALTAYMSVLDQDDDDLRNVGLHRWLKSTGRLEAQTGSSVLSEGNFVQRGWQVYDGVKAAVARGMWGRPNDADLKAEHRTRHHQPEQERQQHRDQHAKMHG